MQNTLMQLLAIYCTVHVDYVMCNISFDVPSQIAKPTVQYRRRSEPHLSERLPRLLLRQFPHEVNRGNKRRDRNAYVKCGAFILTRRDAQRHRAEKLLLIHRRTFHVRWTCRHSLSF